MLQLRNEGEAPAKLFAIPDADGVDTLHVVVQVTFALTPDAPLARAQRPIDLADVREGDGDAAWVRRPGAVQLAKRRTDVLVDGHAVAPGGRAVTWLDAAVTVGPMRRAMRVWGERRFTGRAAPFCSDPAPFTRVPLTPATAFGGRFDAAASGEAEARNPLGVGYVPPGLRDLASLYGRPLPRVEDPAALMQRPGDAPAPMLWTPVAPAWQPRAARAGTYGEAWSRSRAPFLPVDFDERFSQVAVEGAWVEPHLRGGERIVLQHLAEAPVLEARVPDARPAVRARFRGEERALPAHLETLLLLPDGGVATATWRATLRCGHRLLDVAAVTIGWGP